MSRREVKSDSSVKMYLCSGILKGVGEQIGRKIYERFGEESLKVMEESYDRLTAISGISSRKAKDIHDCFMKNKHEYKRVMFFQRYSITPYIASKIIQRYGANYEEVISKNPYRLAREIKGVGFLSADRIAENFGIAKNSQERIMAGIIHVISEFGIDGSSGVSIGTLANKSAITLEVSSEDVLSALMILLKEKQLFLYEYSFYSGGRRIESEEEIKRHLYSAEDDVQSIVMLPVYYHMENGIARKLVQIIRNSGKNKIQSLDIEEGLHFISTAFNVQLSDGQISAFRNIFTHKVSIITGGPGTGKTQLIFSVIKAAKQQMSDIKIKLVAPTGKAAKRIKESSGENATTVHRLLEFDPVISTFRYNEENLLKCDLIVVDESSMIDIRLMNALLKAVSLDTTMVFVGDVDQLPSVGAGQVLNDMITSNMVKVAYLEKIFRQVEHSKIVQYAHMIKNGNVPSFQAGTAVCDGGDVVFFEEELPANVPNTVINLLQGNMLRLLFGLEDSNEMKRQNLRYIMDNVQVISPMQKGEAGVRALNIAMQAKLNQTQEYVKGLNYMYKVGDKVMQVENNYSKKVFNGEIGVIEGIDAQQKEIRVLFEERGKVAYKRTELEQLSLAYAITIHKSQGSEYRAAIIPIMMQHSVMLERRLIYTALTRVKDIAIFVGQKRAFGMGVKRANSAKRYTALRYILQSLDDGKNCQ
ncbi:ATP-dependent RecD-like DNA helicase [Candidatus Fokinia solitaria]|uniref:ATP-dependent RecD-like DNA helicase n=1 Tax=Candidatus Fokinia solitaria TaxID=1802984 RepID=A0A2U8BRG5_9RICK|nr:ATP-dependent RecD-like DNA helicase [Candidatus Fokinia solitaria]AWD32927.1 ATP-dependent RecD-like DNA helicase [Candidatus Fokinia solitaria]